ncbi:MAG: gliding motility-associated C-terminal domain-containing protein [Cytophagaceae bacterium]|nr:gliding motility-associated C-terminal domain-containing protein [Cytophagaceae bacterium]
MHRVCVFVFVLFLPVLSKAQNLVPNPSFEEYWPCTNNRPDIPGCYSSCNAGSLPTPANLLNSATKYWKAATLASVQYLTACNVAISLDDNINYWYQPRSGTAHIIIHTYGTYNSPGYPEVRSYATVALSEQLQTGCRYEITFYAKRAKDKYFGGAPYHSGIATDGLGAYFSSDSICNDSTTTPLYSLIPQMQNPAGQMVFDSINYVKISGIYTALGSEKYLTIGNFKNNTNTVTSKPAFPGHTAGAYFIDDVSVIKIIPQLKIGNGNNLAICEDSTGILTATPGFDSYTWSTGAASPNITTDTAGQFWVKGDYGCVSVYDTMQVFIQQPFTAPFEIIGDTFICEMNNTQITATPGYETYLWSTGSTLDKTYIYSEGTYFVKADYACGSAGDTIYVDVYEPPASLILPAKNDTVICNGSSITLYTIPGFHSHLWNTFGADQYDSSITVNTAKLFYGAAISPEGCRVRDSIEIKISDPPQVNLGNDTTGCKERPVLLSAEIHAVESILWDDGNTQAQREITNAGIYRIKVKNSCATASDTIEVNLVSCSLFIPNLITTNGDGKNDELQILTAVERPLQLEIYNRWGQVIFASKIYKDNWGSNVEPGIYYYHLYDELLNQRSKGWIEVR